MLDMITYTVFDYFDNIFVHLFNIVVTIVCRF